MTDFKYPKKTKMKITAEVVNEFNDINEDDDNTWKEGDIVTIEPDNLGLAKNYDEDDYYDDSDDTYCIHEHSTKCGWSKSFIEDESNFISVKKKITNWKKEFE